jgi:two-component system phosphate regulon sensor histidine kinase PhoR
LARDTEPLAKQKNIQFVVEIHENSIVHGDSTLLRELFLNLIDNAIRYTPAGGCIKLSLKLEHQHAAVSIQDTGIGIPDEEKPHLFERFYRVDKSRSRKDGGAGLGLSICKSIVELHNGTIQFESNVGGGSTFSITLPLNSGV